MPVVSNSDWNQDLGDGFSVANKDFDGASYAFTIATPDIVFSVIRRSIHAVGMPTQHHFDYKAQLITKNPKFHGYF